MEIEEKNENLAAGIVGAFLGSLVGAACIVLVGQLGYVASATGLVMAVCSLKGYEKLAGGFSKKGVVVSSILILLMTYISNRLDWAISVARAADVDIFRAFQSMDSLIERGAIEGSAYWGGLALLYLFVLLGAVPTITRSLRTAEAPAAPFPSGGKTGYTNAAYDSESAFTAADAEFYPSQKGWMFRLRLSTVLAMLLGIPVGLVLLAASNDEMIPIFAALGCIFGAFGAMFAMMPALRLMQADLWTYVRLKGTLYQVNPAQLNILPPYRFSSKVNFTGIIHLSRLTPAEQALAKNAMLRAILDTDSGVRYSGMPYDGMRLRTCVIPLREPRLEKQNRWAWYVSYTDWKGRRKRMPIAKAYPNLSPVPGTEPPTEPVPFRWSSLLLSLAIVLAAGLIGGACGAALEGSLDGDPGGRAFHHGSPSPAPDRQEEPAAAGTDYQPQFTSLHTLDNIQYFIDATFQSTGAASYHDPKTGTDYSLAVLHGADEDAAVDALLEPISAFRTKETFGHFRFSYIEEDDLVPLKTSGGNTFLHNILTVYLTDDDETAIHTAVALDDGGTLIVAKAIRRGGTDEELVTDNLSAVLQSVKIIQEDETFRQTAITEENYQSRFHLASEYAYDYLGCGYIKAPEGMSLKGGFADVYVPYSDNPEYPEDGRALRSQAHGIEVYVTLLPAEGDARTVVDAEFEAFSASGMRIDEAGRTQFDESKNASVKQVLYSDGNNARLLGLYAEEREEGYYLLARITYYAELLDDEYSGVLAELGDAFGLSLPDVTVS